MIPTYAILMLGLVGYGIFFHVAISPYYSIDNLRKTCCGSLFQACRVSGSCYYYFKYWNPQFDELLKTKKPYRTTSIYEPSRYYLHWMILKPYLINN